MHASSQDPVISYLAIGSSTRETTESRHYPVDAQTGLIAEETPMLLGIVHQRLHIATRRGLMRKIEAVRKIGNKRTLPSTVEDGCSGV